jgi:hypothetical protein
VVVEQNIPSAEAALAKARARFEAGQQPPPPEPEPTWGDRLAALRAKVGA